MKINELVGNTCKVGTFVRKTNEHRTCVYMGVNSFSPYNKKLVHYLMTYVTINDRIIPIVDESFKSRIRVMKNTEVDDGTRSILDYALRTVKAIPLDKELPKMELILIPTAWLLNLGGGLFIKLQIVPFMEYFSRFDQETLNNFTANGKLLVVRGDIMKDRIFRTFLDMMDKHFKVKNCARPKEILTPWAAKAARKEARDSLETLIALSRYMIRRKLYG